MFWTQTAPGSHSGLLLSGKMVLSVLSSSVNGGDTEFIDLKSSTDSISGCPQILFFLPHFQAELEFDLFTSGPSFSN